MKAWKKWGRFRFKRPLHENSLKDLREIRQCLKQHKRDLSAARPRGLRGLTRFWKEYRLVMKKRAWVFTMYGNVAGRMKTLKASCEERGTRLRKERIK